MKAEKMGDFFVIFRFHRLIFQGVTIDTVDG